MDNWVVALISGVVGFLFALLLATLFGAVTVAVFATGLCIGVLLVAISTVRWWFFWIALIGTALGVFIFYTPFAIALALPIWLDFAGAVIMRLLKIE